MCERVFEEVLSGNITNDAEVIKVALEQYEERKSRRSELSASQQEQKAEESLTITQILDRQIDEKGNIFENLITTDLLVLDENQNLVRASSIQNGSAGLNQYSIYATMNVSVTADTSAGNVRFNYFDTKLIYGTALTAGSLIQSASYAMKPFFQNEEKTKTIEMPQANVAYRYTPANRDMITYMLSFTGRTCKSVIHAGSKSFTLGYSFTFETCNDNKGTWITEYQ